MQKCLLQKQKLRDIRKAMLGLMWPKDVCPRSCRKDNPKVVMRPVHNSTFTNDDILLCYNKLYIIWVKTIALCDIRGQNGISEMAF